MSTVGVTGPSGFLGWHLRARLHALGEDRVLTADRQTFANEDELDQFVSSCDVVYHLAGVNRGEPAEVEQGNIDLAEKLVAAKARTHAKFNLAYANSTKAGEDSPYGQSKEKAAALLGEAQKGAGDPFANVVLPHLFGEHGRPFYNSAVTTFSHQLAIGDQPEIQTDAELELLHAQDAATTLIGATADSTGSVRPEGTRILVSDALIRLQALAGPYLASGEIPSLASNFDVRLFNMFRSQLFPDHTPISLVAHGDTRGVFFETVRSQGQGQAAVSTTVPGVTRGEHFHFDKIERFVVVRGEATIRIRRLLHDEVHTYEVSGDEPVAIDMPTLHAHNITNTGAGELVTQFWTNDLFDPDKPDTIPEKV